MTLEEVIDCVKAVVKEKLARGIAARP